MPEEVHVRQYKASDYQKLEVLYKKKETYGGEFSEHRDSKAVIDRITSKDPYAVLVAELDGEIVGTISLIENERVAWLYRFCVIDDVNKDKVAEALCEKAEDLLTRRGHGQVLVYSDPNNSKLNERYKKLGFDKGGNYVCFWKDLG